MIEQIKESIIKTLSTLGIKCDDTDIVIEQTNSLGNGDFTTNIAMRLASKTKKNPKKLAKDIVDGLERNKSFSKIEVAGPGFINFFLSKEYLLNELKNILDFGGIEYLKSDIKEGKNILIEYTDPNPFKMMHVGHLYTNTVGESFARLQESTGAVVKRANYQGDVGLHVAKTMWGIEKLLKDEGISFEDIENLELFDRVLWLGKAYQLGSEYYDDIKNETDIKRIKDLNYYIFQLCYPSISRKDFSEFDDIGVSIWYEKGRTWCLDYFERIYDMLGTDFDYYFFESEVGEDGYRMVLENITNGIFKKDEGAVIYEGDHEKGLHTRVFVNKYNLPTYEAKEIGLAKAKDQKGKWDESIVITGMEQKPYFKVVFDVLGKLLPDIAKVSKHIPHALVLLPGMKKMSSRKGSVIVAEDLLNIATSSVKNIMHDNNEDNVDELAQRIAVSAIKYAFLKVSVGKNVIFDIDKDIQFDGDTGPYLMYVYTRALSIIDACDLRFESNECLSGNVDNPYVQDLVRYISKSKSVVLSAAYNYSPSTVCTYLFELGQYFNRFYQNVNVISSKEEDKKFLLSLVEASAEIMNAGLNLLGITTVKRM